MTDPIDMDQATLREAAARIRTQPAADAHAVECYEVAAMVCERMADAAEFHQAQRFK